MKVFPIDKRIRAGYGTAFFLLLLSYLLTLYANRELLNQSKLVDHSNKVIFYLESTISSLKDAETAVRGYLLVKDSQFLQPYWLGKEKVSRTMGLLRGEISKLPHDSSSLDSLNSLIQLKLRMLAYAVAYLPEHQFRFDDTLKNSIFSDEKLMIRIRVRARQTQNDLEKLLGQRTSEMARRHRAVNMVVVISVFFAFLLAAYGFITYSRENTARRKADQTVYDYQKKLKNQIVELDAANKELVQMRSIEKLAATGRIARTIAHEVRNPLTNINLSVDQLKSEPAFKDDTAVLLLDMITRNSNRINQLITDLLNSTKFTELSYHSISINTVMDQTLELAEDRIRLKNIELKKNYSTDVCDVSVDIEKIKIAFLNIIVNAIEAMPDQGGLLQITTAARNELCIVTVEDNGHGVDKESLGKLFEPYFSSKQKGTGLGLTNAQNIIVNHSGSIHVESEPGKGTRFVVQLHFAKK